VTATARQAKAPRESKKGVPRRFRKDNERAKKNEEEYLDGVEFGVLLTLPERPAPARRERVPLRHREKLPVARPAMKDLRGELKWAAGIARNRVAHHGLRLDLYARRFACSAARGADRLSRGIYDYVQMPDSLRVLAELSDGTHPDSKEHARLAKKYRTRQKLRWKRVQSTGAVVGAAVLVALVALWFLLDWLLGSWRASESAIVTVLSWIHVDRILNGWAVIPVVALVAMSVLSFYGRTRGKASAPVMQLDNRPVQRIEGRPSPELVHAAFDHVGIPNISAEIAPHREGPGWETTIRIPVGPKSFADAVKAHSTIAGNLGTGSEGLFLERGPTEKHVIVWWSKQDPFAGDPVPHPVLDPRSGPADLWNKGIRIGIDQRGSEVRIPAVDTPFMVIGGQPGAGKTFSLFGIGAEAGADPIWDLDVWSFKPSNDFAPLEPLVRACGGTFRYGAEPKDLEAFLRYLKALRSEAIARNGRLADLPFDRNPHAKVERDVAADPAFGMRPRIVIADEIQTALPHPGVLAELIEIARVLRSQNIVLAAGMQFVDSTTIEQLQRLLGTRICLSVARHEDSKGVLGGAHEPGLAEGHKIPLSAKGVAIVAGAIAAEGQAPRGAFKMRHYGIPSRQILADHVARQLAGPRAGQTKLSLVKTTDGDPFRTNLAAALAGGPAGVAVLAKALGYGEGTGATRKFTDAARKAGIEPRTETRDAGGVVARGVKYIDPEQLDSH
jgi:hypothetical protein